MNAHSCTRASPPANTATVMLRAGFTEVLVTGMLTRWINVRVIPTVSPPAAAGKSRLVVLSTTKTRMAVMATSVTTIAPNPNAPGDSAPQPLTAKLAASAG